MFSDNSFPQYNSQGVNFPLEYVHSARLCIFVPNEAIPSQVPAMDSVQDEPVGQSFPSAETSVDQIPSEDLNVWDYDYTFYDEQLSSDVTLTLDSYGQWDMNAASYTTQQTSNLDMETMFSTSNRDLSTQECQPTHVSLSTQHFLAPFNRPPNPASQDHDPAPQQPTFPQSLQAIPHPVSPTNAHIPLASESETASLPRMHSCPNCDLTFARHTDLRRHVQSIHLRIRHHCRVAGCGNNFGNGYCRPEKLRKHVLNAHGREEIGAKANGA